MANQALGFPFGRFTNDNQPQDAKYFNRDTKVPYTDMAEALAMLPIGIRYAGLTININGVEYWWEPDSTDLTQEPVIKEIDLSGYQLLSEKSQPNGYASLDANAKLPLNQIPDALIGAVNYQGTWNADTNTPTLPSPSTSNKGQYYSVTIPGTQFGLEFQVKDWVISNGIIWDRVANNNNVTSVFGRTGDVVITPADVNLTSNNRILSRNSSGNFEGLLYSNVGTPSTVAFRDGNGRLKATNAVDNIDLVPLGQLNTLIANKPNKQTITLSQSDLLQDTNNIWYLPYDYTEDIVPVHILYNNKTLLGWQVDRTFTPARLYGFIDNSTATIKLTLI